MPMTPALVALYVLVTALAVYLGLMAYYLTKQALQGVHRPTAPPTAEATGIQFTRTDEAKPGTQSIPVNKWLYGTKRGGSE